MGRTYIKDLKDKIGQEVKIDGFVQVIRDQGGMVFLILRDVTGFDQVVVKKDSKEAFEAAKSLTLESVVEIEGNVEKVEQAPSGCEVKVKKLTVLSKAAPELPIPVLEEKSGGETDQAIRMDWRWIDLRKPHKALIFKIWTTMEHAMREYFIGNNFIEIHSPKLMSAPSESGAELFEVKYFDRIAYLAQSPQFYKQMGMASGFEKVFEVGPVFRANPSFTPRHDTEFTGYDAEISFIESHQDVIHMEEEMLVHVLEKIKEKHGDEIKEVFDAEVIVPETPFPQLTMKEAKKILESLKIGSEREGDLSPEEEREISKYVQEKHHHEFVFVTEYPIEVRPFYHMRKEDDPKLTKSFDLLWKGVEVTTGAQREHRYEVLVKQAEEKGLNVESIKHYLDFFKYGCPPHGGFGHGPTRMLTRLLNIPNVREVTYLYRGVKRLTP